MTFREPRVSPSRAAREMRATVARRVACPPIAPPLRGDLTWLAPVRCELSGVVQMRCSIVGRLLIALGLIAATGVPGFRALDPSTAEARASIRAGWPDEAWTGLLAAPDGSQPGPGDPAEPVDPLIVRFRPGLEQASRVAAHQQAGVTSARALALAGTVRVEVKRARRDQALAAYNARPDVLYAEPDHEVRAQYIPNDPGYPNQWALPTIGAPIAWDITRGWPSVRVAVVTDDCGPWNTFVGGDPGSGPYGNPAAAPAAR